jgi:hypothetical protein
MKTYHLSFVEFEYDLMDHGFYLFESVILTKNLLILISLIQVRNNTFDISSSIKPDEQHISKYVVIFHIETEVSAFL